MSATAAALFRVFYSLRCRRGRRVSDSGAVDAVALAAIASLAALILLLAGARLLIGDPHSKPLCGRCSRSGH